MALMLLTVHLSNPRDYSLPVSSSDYICKQAEGADGSCSVDDTDQFSFPSSAPAEAGAATDRMRSPQTESIIQAQRRQSLTQRVRVRSRRVIGTYKK